MNAALYLPPMERYSLYEPQQFKHYAVPQQIPASGLVTALCGYRTEFKPQNPTVPHCPTCVLKNGGRL